MKSTALHRPLGLELICWILSRAILPIMELLKAQDLEQGRTITQCQRRGLECRCSQMGIPGGMPNPRSHTARLGKTSLSIWDSGDPPLLGAGKIRLNGPMVRRSIRQLHPFMHPSGRTTLRLPTSTYPFPILTEPCNFIEAIIIPCAFTWILSFLLLFHASTLTAKQNMRNDFKFDFFLPTSGAAGWPCFCMIGLNIGADCEQTTCLQGNSPFCFVSESYHCLKPAKVALSHCSRERLSQFLFLLLFPCCWEMGTELVYLNDTLGDNRMKALLTQYLFMCFI